MKFSPLHWFRFQASTQEFVRVLLGTTMALLVTIVLVGRADDFDGDGFDDYTGEPVDGSGYYDSSTDPYDPYTDPGSSAPDSTDTTGQIPDPAQWDVSIMGAYPDGGPDADSDGLSNAYEQEHGWDEEVFIEEYDESTGTYYYTSSEWVRRGLDPMNPDSDGDSIPDGVELLQLAPQYEALGLGFTFDPTDPNDGQADWDTDELPNSIETMETLSNPLATHSDNDEFDDFQEWLLGTDPNDENDPPPSSSSSSTSNSDGGTTESETTVGDGHDTTANSETTEEENEENSSSSDSTDETGETSTNSTNNNTEQASSSPSINPSDIDQDDINDLWERTHGMDPEDSADALADFDSDGLTNLQEYELGTNIHQWDTDSDGLSDGAEIQGRAMDTYAYQMELSGASPMEEYVDHYDPDTGEYLYTEAVLVMPEISMPVYTSDPLLYDTDGDGYHDRWELDNGSNPRNPSDLLVADEYSLPEAISTWTSGYGQLTNALADFDLDGLSNGKEFLFRTDPFQEDTDGDGILDWNEINGYEIARESEPAGYYEATSYFD